MSGVSPLPPPGLEDAELSGDLEHPLQQALLRATGQKTISKLAEDTKVKTRVGQLEAEQVLPVDPRPDRLSGLPITQALAELHQRDQGQAPGRTGWLTLLGIEVGEVAIHEDRPERIAQGEIGAAFGKGGASDAGGLFGHRRDRLLRVERHSEASRDYRTNAALDLPSHPFANGIGPEMGQLRSPARGMSRRPACPAFSRQLLRDRGLTEAPVEASAVAVCEVYDEIRVALDLPSKEERSCREDE